MAHEIAKLLLEHADSIAERATAIRTAMSLGMRLDEIEDYLDWLEHVRPAREEEKEGRGGEEDS